MSGQANPDPSPNPAAPNPNPANPAPNPAAAPNPADPTQGGKTAPIGGADGAALSIYKPQGIPDHLVGQSNEETIDRMLRENAGFRQAQATKPNAFAKPEDVTFEWGDKVKSISGIADNDPALGLFRDLAVKHKMTPEQAGAIPAFFEAALEKGLIEPPYNPGKVLDDLAPADFRGTPQERQAKGGERLRTAENWIGQLPESSGYDAEVKSELRLLTTSAAGVRTLELFMKSGMNPSVAAGGQGQQQQGVTKADLERRTADPRYWADNPKYDPAFAKETQELWKQLYPD